MKIDLEKTDFQNVEDVEVPSSFFNRFKTNVDLVDALFGGNGFLPGSTFALAGGPGSGKSTFLLQIGGSLAQLGKNVAYISGEESIVQISFNCRRMCVKSIKVSNMTDVDEICDQIEKNKFDFVVIDSFPTITTKKAKSSKKKEEYVVNRLCSIAKKNDTVIGFIQHVTKQGNYKGSTLLPHSVDMTIKMSRNEDDPQNLNVRDFMVTKNRFGSNAFISLNLTQHGFDFDREANKPKDPLEGVKKVSLQQAISMFGSYYKAQKELIAAGFTKRKKEFVRG
jgi:predicted ATP-dependent serine protease